MRRDVCAVSTYSLMDAFRSEYDASRTPDELWLAVNSVRYSTQPDNYRSLLIASVCTSTMLAVPIIPSVAGGMQSRSCLANKAVSSTPIQNSLRHTLQDRATE